MDASKYGLLKVNNEIITYTGITTNSFTGCTRGFSGITNLKNSLNQEKVVFETSENHQPMVLEVRYLI